MIVFILFRCPKISRNFSVNLLQRSVQWFIVWNKIVFFHMSMVSGHRDTLFWDTLSAIKACVKLVHRFGAPSCWCAVLELEITDENQLCRCRARHGSFTLVWGNTCSRSAWCITRNRSNKEGYTRTRIILFFSFRIFWKLKVKAAIEKKNNCISSSFEIMSSKCSWLHKI